MTEVNNDITEERRGRDARLYLASIVETSDDAIVGKTLGRHRHDLEPGSRRRCSATSLHEMIGRSITLLHPPDRQHEEAMILDGCSAVNG